MQRPLFVLGAVALFATRSVPAQQTAVDPHCQSLTSGDACQKALDLYKYLNNQLGTLIVGGNATLGQGGTLGGLGHFSVGVRLNFLQAHVPDVHVFTTQSPGPAVSTTFRTDGKYVAFPQADVAIGLFRGFPIGITYIGGVDGLVSVAYLPTFEKNDVQVSNSVGALRFGFGGRIGLLQETVLTPGISVSYIERNLPKATIVADGSYGVSDMDLNAKSWRIVANKTVLGIGLGAGFGRDYYDSHASLVYPPSGALPQNPPGTTSNTVATSPTRTSIFGDLSFNLIPLIKFVGELGRVSGGSVNTFNTYDRSPNESQWYGSIGARVVF